MQHRLNILTKTAAAIWEVQAETPLGPSPQLATPESIAGKLLNLTESEILQLATGQYDEVGIEGHPYRFTRLDADGSFTLTRISRE